MAAKACASSAASVQLAWWGRKGRVVLYICERCASKARAVTQSTAPSGVCARAHMHKRSSPLPPHHTCMRTAATYAPSAATAVQHAQCFAEPYTLAALRCQRSRIAARCFTSQSLLSSRLDFTHTVPHLGTGCAQLRAFAFSMITLDRLRVTEERC